ncbi:MAG: hypothetical protein K9H25_16340 [Rhodospirillum sp.]|nr:hypothetical protein [Rhodospirillum sp.]MCF8490952.1 hypothetical protein [Rhodospirillum sp.]MCF8501470.1 hypothetical protein [Rhodospirillum sp.]
MPTSSAMSGTVGQMGGDDAYHRELRTFHARHVRNRAEGEVVAAFHAVRRMPYHSGCDRTPLTALRMGKGACTAKHILLRDLLRLSGIAAEVEIVEGRFGSGMPVVDSMPEAVKSRIQAGGVRDFHCRVSCIGPWGEHILDATWHDAVADDGFPVNADWRGEGPTKQAIAAVTVCSRDEDVLTRKEELLAGLSKEEADTRKVFLELFSQWLEKTRN